MKSIGRVRVIDQVENGEIVGHRVSIIERDGDEFVRFEVAADSSLLLVIDALEKAFERGEGAGK